VTQTATKRTGVLGTSVLWGYARWAYGAICQIRRDVIQRRHPLGRHVQVNGSRVVVDVPSSRSEEKLWSRKLVRKGIPQDLVAIKKYEEPPGRLRYLADQAEANRLLTACPGCYRHAQGRVSRCGDTWRPWRSCRSAPCAATHNVPCHGRTEDIALRCLSMRRERIC